MNLRAATVVVVTLLAGLAAAARAAVPAPLTHQGRLLDADGQPVTTNQVFTYKIYDAATDGNTLWTETLTVPVDQGYFSVQLGLMSPITDALLAGGDRYLGIQVGSDDEMIPREQLSSVPYARLAGEVSGDIHPQQRLDRRHGGHQRGGQLGGPGAAQDRRLQDGRQRLRQRDVQRADLFSGSRGRQLPGRPPGVQRVQVPPLRHAEQRERRTGAAHDLLRAAAELTRAGWFLPEVPAQAGGGAVPVGLPDVVVAHVSGGRGGEAWPARRAAGGPAIGEQVERHVPAGELGQRAGK